jgi:hypothetical protein
MKRNVVGALFGAVMLVAGPSSLSAATLSGTKWGSPVFGTGATVTWSFMAAGVCCDDILGGPFVALTDFMPAGFDTAIRAAFASWAAVADIVFAEVPDGGENFNARTGACNIRLGGHVLDGASGVLAHGHYPPPNGWTAAGDIRFDVDEICKPELSGPGFDIFVVTAHEIGHAIGVAHTNVPGSLMQPYHDETSWNGPQADDIAGARGAIHGAPVAAAVPLPGSLPLLLGGMGLTGALGLRRKRGGPSAAVRARRPEAGRPGGAVATYRCRDGLSAQASSVLRITKSSPDRLSGASVVSVSTMIMPGCMNGATRRASALSRAMP